MRLLVDPQHTAVGGDDVGGEQVVDGEAVLAGEVADTTTGRQPAKADRARVAEADGKTVRVRRFGELARGQA